VEIMANKHGEFIWYELMTRDPFAAKGFYDDVVGWTIGERLPGDIDYRVIAAGNTFVGGVFRLTDEMCEHGARPIWLGYIGVDDVDVTVSRAETLGGRVLMPARDIPDIGRIAMVADPQGAPFYVMRGAVEGKTSTAFNPTADGHCCWNELSTTDQTAALTFYGRLFGWSSDEVLPMGDMGEYVFFKHLGGRIGAVTAHMGKREVPSWLYYFHVPDIDAAKARAEALGGRILHGPLEVPIGEQIIIGTDPEGVTFALVGTKKADR
jgi:predicted enzyme related to lactoylglutathione lyase